MRIILCFIILLLLIVSCKKDISSITNDRINTTNNFPNHFSSLELQMPKADITVKDSCYYGTPGGFSRSWSDTSIVLIDIINTNLFNRHNYELHLNLNNEKICSFNLGDIQSSTNYYETFFSNGTIIFDSTNSTCDILITTEVFIDQSNGIDFRKYEINSSSIISFHNLSYTVNDTGLVSIIMDSDSLNNSVIKFEFDYNLSVRNVFYSEDTLRMLIKLNGFEPTSNLILNLFP